MLSGLVGVPAGAWLGAALLRRWPRAQPVICGAGLLLSAPAMAAGMLLVENYFVAPFVFMFLGELALNLNWAIVADMSLVRDRLRDRFSFAVAFFEAVAIRGDLTKFFNCFVA